MKVGENFPNEENGKCRNDAKAVGGDDENEDNEKLCSELNAGKDVDEHAEAEEDEVSKLKEEIIRLNKTSENNLSKLRYLLADFDNYRKQVEKQMEAKIEVVRAELLSKLINIEDDYERAIDTISDNNCAPSIMDGLYGILRNIESLLKSESVVEIEALGTPFDPSVHDAVSYTASESEPENMVIGVVRKGFMLNNKVLRPSLVILSKKIISNKDTD
jgi:molecular chaperone GrpE